jgi:hypothetical protein
MARTRKPSAIPLTEVKAGDAFLAPLQDGRLSVCRVLRVEPDHSQALVAASTWIGTEPPDLADPWLREILRPNHHAHEGRPWLLWVSDPVPASFTRLGTITPTAEEASLSCASWSGWESFPLQVFLQWRWDHERDQVLAEDEAKRRAEEAAREEQRRAYQPLPARTLQELRARTHFPHWAGYAGPTALRGARRIVREMIDALIELGPDAPEPTRLDEINRCVERFNELDEEEGGFIETIERDDIFELVHEIAALVGLEDYGDYLIGVRDW